MSICVACIHGSTYMSTKVWVCNLFCIGLLCFCQFVYRNCVVDNIRLDQYLSCVCFCVYMVCVFRFLLSHHQCLVDIVCLDHQSCACSQYAPSYLISPPIPTPAGEVDPKDPSPVVEHGHQDNVVSDWSALGGESCASPRDQFRGGSGRYTRIMKPVTSVLRSRTDAEIRRIVWLKYSAM